MHAWNSIRASCGASPAQFPDLAARAQEIPADFIADGELLAWQEGRALPFAELQKRLGRRGDDFFLGAEVPVSLWLYDLIGDWVAKACSSLPLRERRAQLDALPLVPRIERAPFQQVRRRGRGGGRFPPGAQTW